MGFKSSGNDLQFRNLTITQKCHTMLDIIRRNNNEQGRMTTTRFASEAIPVRKGERPKTIMDRYMFNAMDMVIRST
jgi:hypothetical protein